jgi:hypothetical protein
VRLDLANDLKSLRLVFHYYGIIEKEIELLLACGEVEQTGAAGLAGAAASAVPILFI